MVHPVQGEVQDGKSNQQGDNSGEDTKSESEGEKPTPCTTKVIESEKPADTLAMKFCSEARDVQDLDSPIHHLALALHSTAPGNLNQHHQLALLVRYITMRK